MVRFV